MATLTREEWIDAMNCEYSLVGIYKDHPYAKNLIEAVELDDPFRNEEERQLRAEDLIREDLGIAPFAEADAAEDPARHYGKE